MPQVHDWGIGSMHGSERIKAFWGTVRERSAAGARLRRRIAATAAIVAHSAAESGSRTAHGLMQTALSTSVRLASRVPQADPHRKALQLNAAGTQYRRDGLYDHAVECHRRALEILRALDDRQAVALTQSNMALALSHAGDDGWAIGL